MFRAHFASRTTTPFRIARCGSVAICFTVLASCGSDGGAPSAGAGAPNAGGSGGTAIAGYGGGDTGPSAGGSTSSGGMPSGGTSSSGSGGGAGSVVDSDDYVSDVAVAVHERVETILVVTWTQTIAAESVWLEFSFDGEPVMTSRAKPGTTGAHRDVVLGVPEQTDVSIRVVSRQGGVDYVSSVHQGTTGALPSGTGGIPRPEILAYDPTRASPERFMLAAVENSQGGCGPSCYNRWTYWTYIMDRKGRIVWYYADPGSNATSSYQRIARDGEYLWIEKRPYGGAGERGVLKMTLDWEYFEEIPVAGLSDCIDVATSGSLLYDAQNTLREMTPDGQIRDIWSCSQHFGQGFSCYSNTVNWNPLDDTVLMSFPEENTVVEIDRETGALVGLYGDASGAYAFSPSTWEFEFQHFPNITAEGTLMVSSHMPGFEDTYTPVAGEHAFIEFEIDRDSETLIEKWVYHDGPEWPMYKGMAIKLPNGNVLANYGSGGVIREITPDKQTVFHVKFDAPNGDDFYNKMVGHNVYIDDLYALNGGPQ